jgi:short subunit fatty acids transporter
MKSVRFAVMTAFAFGLPLAATTQQSLAKGTPSDVKYCAAMAKAYSSLFPAQEGMAASDVVLLSRCDTDTQATIAALEHKLKDKKIDLPSDGRVAQPPGSSVNTQ